MEALQRLHNRGSISTGPYEIDNSLKFESDNTEYLMAEGRPAGNQQTWTYSTWLKRTEVDNGVVAQMIFSAGSDGKTSLYFRDDASYPDDQIFIYVDEGNALKWIGRVNQSFRDTAAWYHIVFAVDSTDATAADRTKIYVNGVEQTITFNATLNQNVSTRVGDGGNKFAIGGKVSDTSYGFNGYMAECVLVDGSALAPTSFGEFDEDSGIWKPKSPPALGTAGFHMNFDDSSNVGAVQSGTSQGNFDKYNLTAADQATDTPTNNFAIGNPLNVTPPGIFTEGATRWVSVNGTGMNGAWNLATIALTGGKWHCEVKCISTSSYYQWGISPTHPNDSFSSRCFYRSDGNIYNAGSGGNTTGHTTYTAGDIIGMSYDASANTVIFSKNGTAVVTKTAIAHNDPYFFGGTGLSAGTYTGDFNFGGYTSYTISSPETDENGYGTFEYAPPSGYYALCTKNLEEFG